jgi:hypothetical protein
LADRLPTLNGSLQENAHDVDLYIGVARQLLHSPPATTKSDSRTMSQAVLERLGLKPTEDKTQIGPGSYSVTGQELAVNSVVANIDTLRLQIPCVETNCSAGLTPSSLASLLAARAAELQTERIEARIGPHGSRQF